MKTKIIILISFLVLSFSVQPCTTAVISGKATPDGRPMIWKIRDTDHLTNCVKYYQDGKYSYVGLINSEDKEGTQVWGGSNCVGFAIMNSASFNVNSSYTGLLKDKEGVFMKEALMKCVTLADFEKLLDERERPMGLAAHFGVIDAEGGAAFYEVNNETWTKFDANDPEVAPDGYVIRTNFSQTGIENVGYGFIRRQTAEELFKDAASKKQLDSKTVMQNFSRSLRHSVLDRDYRAEYEKVAAGNYFVTTDDLLTRHGTSSTIMVQGVKKGEPKDMNTLWIQVGYPHTCVTTPIWVRQADKLPEVLLLDDKGNSPLNRFALSLKNECYPLGRSDGYHYMLISKLINAEHNGIMQQIERYENTLFAEAEQIRERQNHENAQGEEVAAFYDQMNKEIRSLYSEFGLK